MTGFLLDTNIPSELTRRTSDAKVERWLDRANDDELFFSVISLGEILNGITILPASKRRAGLQTWLDGTLRPWFEGRPSPPKSRSVGALLPESSGSKVNRLRLPMA